MADQMKKTAQRMELTQCGWFVLKILAKESRLSVVPSVPMKHHSNLLWFHRRFAVLLLAFAAALALASTARSQDTTTNTVPASPKASAAVAEKPKHQLTGAELYSMHCNRCHPERYPTERTAAQWKTILLHMRIRANLPAEHARIILKYLQENSGR